MRKLIRYLLYIPLSIFVAFQAYAFTTSYLTPNLVPDTALMPRVPMGIGSIGSIFGKMLGTNDLANYHGDGTVQNTLLFSGTSATGFLHRSAPCT
jgi:hypothetical protein